MSTYSHAASTPYYLHFCSYKENTYLFISLFSQDTSDLGRVANHLQCYASRFVKRFLPEYLDTGFSPTADRHEDRPAKKRKQEHPTHVLHIR